MLSRRGGVLRLSLWGRAIAGWVGRSPMDAASDPSVKAEAVWDSSHREANAMVCPVVIVRRVNRTGLVGVAIVRKRGCTHGEGHHRGEADDASLQL